MRYTPASADTRELGLVVRPSSVPNKHSTQQAWVQAWTHGSHVHVTSARSKPQPTFHPERLKALLAYVSHQLCTWPGFVLQARIVPCHEQPQCTLACSSYACALEPSPKPPFSRSTGAKCQHSASDFYVPFSCKLGLLIFEECPLNCFLAMSVPRVPNSKISLCDAMIIKSTEQTVSV